MESCRWRRRVWVLRARHPERQQQIDQVEGVHRDRRLTLAHHQSNSNVTTTPPPPPTITTTAVGIATAFTTNSISATVSTAHVVENIIVSLPTMFEWYQLTNGCLAELKE